MIIVSQWEHAVVFEPNTVTITTEDSDEHCIRVDGLLFGRFEEYTIAKCIIEEIVSEVTTSKVNGSIEVYKVPREKDYIASKLK